jgi:hypothetical protein
MNLNRHFRFIIATSYKHSNTYDLDHEKLWIVVNDKYHSGINSRIYKNYSKYTLDRVNKIIESYRKENVK